jgi:hypothetical protein
MLDMLVVGWRCWSPWRRYYRDFRRLALRIVNILSLLSIWFRRRDEVSGGIVVKLLLGMICCGQLRGLGQFTRLSLSPATHNAHSEDHSLRDS